MVPKMVFLMTMIPPYQHSTAYSPPISYYSTISSYSELLPVYDCCIAVVINKKLRNLSRVSMTFLSFDHSRDTGRDFEWQVHKAVGTVFLRFHAVFLLC